MKMQWKQIREYPNWEVSSSGAIRNRATKTLKYLENDRGYFRSEFSRDGHERRVRVHRIVAEHFIANPKKHKTINHINGVRNDNRVQNLEWVTQAENNKHGREVLGNYYRSITQLTPIKGVVGLVFFGHKQLAEAGFTSATVTNCINRPDKFKSHRGYKVFRITKTRT